MKGCRVTGVTISGQQVNLARMLTSKEARIAELIDDVDSFVGLGDGGVRYMELDAESLGVYYNERSEKALFDCVWISEALSHLPNKELFFQNAISLLKSRGKLVVADWFMAEDLTKTQVDADIKPIEGR
jgi:tocopherol O-methyltransferase